MNGNRFDDEVCGLGAGGSKRRGVLKALVASGAVAALGRVSGRPASAKAKKAKGPCGKNCGAACDPRTAIIFCDQTIDTCGCVRSTSDKTYCGDGRALDNCPAAGSPDQCSVDADCGPNEICMRTAGGVCCSGSDQAQVNFCVPLCGSASPMAKPGKGFAALFGARERRAGR
jgi:hypothetical protein